MQFLRLFDGVLPTWDGVKVVEAVLMQPACRADLVQSDWNCEAAAIIKRLPGTQPIG
jgi:hypothetical protein